MKRLTKFAVIGCLGFLTEVALIKIAITMFDKTALEARFVSFPVAVVVTWVLNRKYNFNSKSSALPEASRYFVMQIAGALTNLGSFLACVLLVPGLSQHPVTVLGFAALVGFLVNFFLSSFFVFLQSEERR